MPLLSVHDTLKYLFGSIFIGVLLGAIGAGMANSFRHGIVLITNLEIHLLRSLPLFYFYFITLSVSAIFVNLVKKKIQNSVFHGVADSIYFAHKSRDCVDIKTGMLSTLAAFISASGGLAFRHISVACPLQKGLTKKDRNSFLKAFLRDSISRDPNLADLILETLFWRPCYAGVLRQFRDLK